MAEKNNLDFFPENAPTANPIFYRTYSRRQIKNGHESKETWDETCSRSTRGLRELGKLTPEQAQLINEMQLNCKALPSGRWLWVGGTKWLENPDNFPGAYNCSNFPVTDWTGFSLLMNLAMMGVGTGTILEPNYINQLPDICNCLNVVVLEDLGTAPVENRKEFTEVDYGADYINIWVGDSRQGWTDAYQRLLEASSYQNFSRSIKVVVSLKNVRPAGKPLSGFGGVSNPARLPQLFIRCAEILNEAVGRKLNSLECCLLIDEAAATIVAGNIRRCLPIGSLVHTESGLVAIENIKIGDRVLTSKGFYPVTNLFDQGIQSLYRIQTENGCLECTSEHKIAVLQELNSNYQMVKAKRLKKNDRLIFIENQLMLPASTELSVAVNLIPAKIEKIEIDTRKAFTYDIEVAEVHEFVCQGFLVSNSAGMRQGSPDDKYFVGAKDNLWVQNEAGDWGIDPKRDVLRMANHTLVYRHKPTREECVEAVKKQFHSGEGAIMWAGEAIARANADLVFTLVDKQDFLAAYSKEKGEEWFKNKSPNLPETELKHRLNRLAINPCGEILGFSFMCNLSEIHLNQINPFNFEEQKLAFLAGAISAAALLNHKFSDSRLQDSRKLDPIVGVSFTGLFDFFVNLFGSAWLDWWVKGRHRAWRSPKHTVLVKKLQSLGAAFPDFSPIKIEKFQTTSALFYYYEAAYLKWWRSLVFDKVWEYCDRHSLKRPNRCTTVQPAGTKSLLTNASPGWHPPFGLRWVRRITFAKNDPVALACIDYGYSVIPSQSDKDESGNLLNDPFDERVTEWLVEIPTEVSWASQPGVKNISIENFSALAMFDFYMGVQKNWTTHNTSATILLTESEIEPLGDRIHKAIQDDEGYVSVALLSRFDAPYPRLPFERISKEEYEKKLEEIQGRRKSNDFGELVNHHIRDTIEAGPQDAACSSLGCNVS